MSWESWERAAERGPMALLWKIAFAAIGFCVVITVILGLLGFVANPFVQTGRIINKTIDADNVIANYEWFKQRHESIASIDRKIAESEAAVSAFADSAGERSSWHREDREEHSRLSAVVLGLKQQRADMASEYNARSRMVNRSIFKAGDTELPERIEP